MDIEKTFGHVLNGIGTKTHRIVLHIVFWVLYYIVFSLTFAEEGNYYNSFALELFLLPVRISASYFCIYHLIPRYLLKEHVVKFLIYYILLITVAGVLQRVFIYYYYELLMIQESTDFFEFFKIIRSIVLVNSTVLFLTSIKMFQHWNKLKSKVIEENKIVELKVDKRMHRVATSNICYIEGLGNYVIFYRDKGERLVSYISLKSAKEMLPDNFIRIHKSFIVNKAHIQSYTSDSVEVMGRILPVGKMVKIETQL